MGVPRVLQFAELETGCFVPIRHRVNGDGYFRVNWNDRPEMFHRVVYRLHNGDIPRGQEVDHLCKVRSCCNPKHLRLLDGKHHAILSNRERYAERKDAAKEAWEHSGRTVTGTALGQLYGVSFSCSCAWIREWRRSPLP